MSERLTIRLDDTLHARLSDVAQQRGVTTSDVVRLALQAWLEGPATDGAKVSDGGAPTAHTAEACAQTILEYCPPELQEQILAGAARMELSVREVLPALLITAWEEVQRQVEVGDEGRTTSGSRG